jgi:hypothetical protein
LGIETRRRVEFTNVELAGDMELATLVEKVAAGPVEKAMAGGRRGGEGERWAAVLWHGGDADRRSGGAMEREERWRGERDRQGDAAERSRGELS